MSRLLFRGNVIFKNYNARGLSQLAVFNFFLTVWYLNKNINNYFKKYINRCNQHKFPAKIVVDEKKITNTHSIAENFNNYWTEIGPNLANNTDPPSKHFHDYLKSCVRYIFAILFFKSKGEHLWNLEKCFLLHFKSSFRSPENQILVFQIFKFHDVIKCLSVKQEIHFT